MFFESKARSRSCSERPYSVSWVQKLRHSIPDRPAYFLASWIPFREWIAGTSLRRGVKLLQRKMVVSRVGSAAQTGRFCVVSDRITYLYCGGGYRTTCEVVTARMRPSFSLNISGVMSCALVPAAAYAMKRIVTVLRPTARLFIVTLSGSHRSHALF